MTKTATAVIIPTRGVVAGDAMAMSLVTAYMIEGLAEVKEAMHHCALYTVYVDDLQLQVTTNQRDLAQTTVQAAQQIADGIVGLGLVLN